MRFGIFYEHQIPRPWAPDAEERALLNALEQVELADSLGIDHVWEVEHHFLEEYSHSSAPEVFLAAASQRTSRIRLGHGIVALPPAYNHPARVAERVATLDLISGGRVDFGTGETSSQSELGGFGVPREAKRAQWEESLETITRMFVEEPFAGTAGEWITMPPRNVVPKPKQKPHPPLWVACSRRDTILMAARKGIGALSFSFVEPEQAKAWVDEYYRILASEECVPAGFAVNPNVAVVVPLMCHADEATAIERGIDGAHFFGYSLAHYYVFGEHRPARTDVWAEFTAHRGERGFTREIVRPDAAPLGVQLLEQGLGSLRGAVGTPEQVRELLRRYAAAGVDQVIFAAQTGHTRHEHVLESLELFGREVLPEFAERAAEVEEEKAARLAGAVDAALARRAPARSMPDTYVITTAGEPAPAPPWRAQPAGGTASVRTRIAATVATAVRQLPPGVVEPVLVSTPALSLVFRTLAQRFRPEAVPGFAGDVQYRLSGGGRTQEWYLRLGRDGASAHRGRSGAPALTLTMPVTDFLQVGTGAVAVGELLRDGRLQVDGDLALLARHAEMFTPPGSF